MQWSQTAITCRTPPGVGQFFAVVVRVLTLCGTIGCSSDSQLIQDARNTAFNVSYNPPTVQSITPSGGPLGGDYPVLIRGASFGMTASAELHAFVNSKAVFIPLHVISSNNSFLVVRMGAATGRNLSIAVTAGGQTTTVPNAWSFDPPSVVGLSAAAFLADAPVPVHVHGSNFGLLDSTVSPSPAVYLGAVLCAQPLLISPTHIQCTAPESAVGAYPVTGMKKRRPVMLHCDGCSLQRV